MATVSEIETELATIKTAVSTISTDVDNLQAAIADLKQQIANGGVATQADLDALDTAAKDIQTSLAAVDTKAQP